MSGKTVTAKELEAKHDAVLLAGGSEEPFDFFAKSPGRNLDGIHYAMTFLPQQNRRVAGEAQGSEAEISAKDKHVIVIGGGDTGSDCIGTSFRQGAKSVTQLEIMPMPPEKENKALSWPHWPLKLRVSSSQAEGAKVEYSISTTGFAGKNGKVEKLLYTRVDNALKPVPGSEGELPADLVLFAMGFSGPVESDLVGGAGPAGGAARPLQGPRRQREGLSPQGAQEVVCRRRHPPRAEPGRVGDPRGPAGCARDRPLPDGPQRPAALATRAMIGPYVGPFSTFRVARARYGGSDQPYRKASARKAKQAAKPSPSASDRGKPMCMAVTNVAAPSSAAVT